MAFIAYVKPIEWAPDPTYVNDPLQTTMEYYAIRLGTNVKQALWSFYPAVAVPTQDLEVDILGNDFTKYQVDEDLQKYGFTRNYLVEESITQVEEKLNENVVGIEELM